MQTKQGFPREVSKTWALPSRGYPRRDRKLATPGHTRQNESRGKRDIQRTSGEYGEEKLISSLPFFGLTLWLPCHTYDSGFFNWGKGDSTSGNNRALLSRDEGKWEGQENSSWRAGTMSPILQNDSSSEGKVLRDLLTRGFSLPLSLSSPCASAVPSASGSFSQDLVFNRPPRQTVCWVWRSTLPLPLNLGQVALPLCASISLSVTGG